MLAVEAGAERMTQAMRSLEALFLIGIEGVTEIWLVRHGDCYEGMSDGGDPPLSPLGRKQAARLAERVRRLNPAAVYASPYRRAVETAQAISDDLTVEPRLVEMAMVVVSVTLTGQTLRWISVIAAVGLFAFNVIGLPTYSGLYDKFLIVVGLGWNAATAWYAWTSYP